MQRMPMPRRHFLNNQNHCHHLLHNIFYPISLPLLLLFTFLPHAAGILKFLCYFLGIMLLLLLHRLLLPFPTSSDPNPCNFSYISCSNDNFFTKINIQSVFQSFLSCFFSIHVIFSDQFFCWLAEDEGGVESSDLECKEDDNELLFWFFLLYFCFSYFTTENFY